MGLTWKDAVTTVLVAALGGMAWAYYTDQGWPLVSGPRVLAVVAFLVGVVVCATGARNLNAKESELGVGDRLLRSHALIAFALTVWAAITGNEVVIGVLVGLIVAMWLGSTVYHAFSKPPVGAS